VIPPLQGDNMRDEKTRISQHHEAQVDSIQNELTIQLLSFTGLTIAFGIGLMRTFQMYRKSKANIKNLK